MSNSEDNEKLHSSEKKSSGVFSKVIVLLVIVLNTLFTLKVFDIVEKGVQEPTSLIAAWFGFTTVELWSLSSIKKKKEDKKQVEAVAKIVNKDDMS